MHGRIASFKCLVYAFQWKSLFPQETAIMQENVQIKGFLILQLVIFRRYSVKLRFFVYKLTKWRIAYVKLRSLVYK
jgi:hypothetical protein